MDPIRNPYAPGAGQRPPELAGRDEQLGLTVVDLKRSATITHGWIRSRAGWTPYDGMTVTSWPVGTFVRGHPVMWEGELSAPGRGEAVQFVETLAGV